MTDERIREMREYAGKAIRCAPLLPAPGDVEVALFARQTITLLDELERLRAQLKVPDNAP